MNKDKQNSNQTQDFVRIYKSVLQIFQQIQEASTLNKAHVMDLVKIHKENSFFFDKSLQQAFLRIFKSFHQKANKKIPSRFETVVDLLFKQILKAQSDQSITSLNQFCNLCSEAIFSAIMNVRIMASRILFLVLKGLPNVHSLAVLITQKNQNLISKSVLFLVKQKVSTYRQLGIKLASLILLMKSDHFAQIQNEMFKILSTQQNQMIRKMVMTNIPINKGNIEKLLVRLRDKNTQIRATLLRKLLTQNYRLQNLKLNSIYKILYDGYGTKDVICKEQALRYFASFFKQSQMDQQNKFQSFVQYFQPNLLLVNSHLYVLFNKLLGQLLGYLPSAPMCEYIRKLCNKVKACNKDKNLNISNELIWLKNASAFKPQIKQINNIFEEYSPSGSELAQLLIIFLEKKNIFAINEFLQLFSNIKMPDQIGRDRMFDTLTTILTKLTLFDIKVNLDQIDKNDDICNVQTNQQIQLKKFMLSYYDIPIISSSIDLIFPIVQAMKSLRPQYFTIKLQQTISGWDNPQEHIFKEKQSIQLTLKGIQGKKQEPGIAGHIKTLKLKLIKIDQEIDFLKHKTVVAITSLSKIQFDWNIEDYMPLIKDELSKENQSYGIYLLGLYCLQSVDKVKLFFPLYWHHVMNAPANSDPNSQQYRLYKLHLMISLKIMTDFIVKFNILKLDEVMNNTSTDQASDYNADTFMQKLTHLILNKDTDIRIFSIQCLCRMIYHNRVDENNISTYFLYLLLLWWQTSTEQVSAKSVHTISLFFRSYLEKGNQQVKKLAQMLCIFHKILKIFEEKNKTINKKLIVYNLKINEFIKKTVSIATTVLKYHKEKKTIWTYQEPELGPQQFFLLYLLYEPGFQNTLQKPVNVCDFYVQCPLQTLIFVKKKVERFQQLVDEGEFFPSSYRLDKTITKKSLEQINRFQKQIQGHISVKNQETFNQQIINTLQKIFSQSCKYVNQQARRIAKNIEQQQIFININSDDEEQSQQIQISSSDSDSEPFQEQNRSQRNSNSQELSQSNSPQKKTEQNQNSLMRSNQSLITNNNKRPKARKIVQKIEPSDDQSNSSQSVVQIKPSTRGRKRAPVIKQQHSQKQDSNQPSSRRVLRARKPIF